MTTVDPSTRTSRRTDALIQRGVIEVVGPSDAEIVDAFDMVVIPGSADAHCHASRPTPAGRSLFSRRRP